MSNKFKDVARKKHTYCFFDDIIIIKSFDPNKIKINEKSNKNIAIYFMEYVMIKDSRFLKINSINSSYLVINKVNEYFKEINRNKYLALVPANESKEITKDMKNCGVKSEI